MIGIFEESKTSLELRDYSVSRSQGILYKIYRETEGWSIASSFFSECSRIKRESSCCSLTGRVTGVIAGTLLGVGYIGSAVGSAYLAGKAAMDGEGWEDPIIGHTAEWSMLAIFTTLILIGAGPYQLAQKGYIHRTCDLFDYYRQDPSLSTEDLQALEKAELNLISIKSQNIFSRIYLFPKDRTLQGTFDAIKQQLNDLSIFKTFCSGLSEIKKRKGACFIAAMLTSGIALASLFTFESAVYIAGIKASGKQAYDDYMEGINPSIIGHCLEWAGEFVGMWSLFTILREVVNIGEVKEMKKIFAPHMGKESSRLKQVMEMQMGQIGQGRIFSLPISYLYENDPNITLSTSEEKVDISV